MTMTSLIQGNKDFRDAVRLTTTRPVVKGDGVFVEPKSKRYGLVGTAFDYLVGFAIKHHNPGMIKTKSSLVAERALAILRHERRDKDGLRSVGDASLRLETCKVHASVFVEDGHLTREFVASLLEISQLDQLYRAGIYPRLPLPRASSADIADMMALYQAMPSDRFVATQSAYVGPDFGFSSRMVGGADADFVIDGCLMDTKTTIKQSITLSMWCQVVGQATAPRIIN